MTNAQRKLSQTSFIDCNDIRGAHRIMRNMVNRDLRDYSAEEIARAVGISANTVHRLADGKTKSAHMRTLSRLGEWFGYSTGMWK